MIRRALDTLYLLSGGAAALSLFALLILVVVQMMARWAGATVTGITELAGYCMGATSFFALGYALNCNAHIRVEILIAAMDDPANDDRRGAEILSVTIACLIAAAFAFFAVTANVVSYLLEEKSQGQDALPVWIPQLVMSAGTIVLLIALLDRLVRLVRHGEETVDAGEATLTDKADEMTGRF